MEQKFKLTDQNHEFLRGQQIIDLIEEIEVQDDGPLGCSTQLWVPGRPLCHTSQYQSWTPPKVHSIGTRLIQE